MNNKQQKKKKPQTKPQQYHIQAWEREKAWAEDLRRASEVDQSIERNIARGMIVSDEFIKKVSRYYGPDCLESNSAKTIASQ